MAYNTRRRRRTVLPTTVLSGFLGSGKTTLLRHILENKQDLKCAVIVNDMAELNIDASLVRSGGLVQAEEKLIEMQNGCICCTLREDLLIEVKRLALSGKFDYLIVESTGIGEPQQVAETFELSGEGGTIPLKSFARLDTLVTVVDAAKMRTNLGSIQTLAEREKDEDIAGGDRNVSELLLEQIEFSNIILLNKIDLVTNKEARKLANFLQTLNPDAEIIMTTNSKVELSKVLNTKLYDPEKAARSPGWLKSLTEGHNPETLEYDIGSFVYRARVPFHPNRLWNFINSYFAFQQMVPIGDRNDENNKQDEKQEEEGEFGFEIHAEPLTVSEVSKKQCDLNSKYGEVLRSKGFIWLAGRDQTGGEWSQAGAVLRLSPGGPWFAAMPEDAWGDVDIDAVKRDFEPCVGDRRQELVFIGIGLKKEELSAELNKCLCAPQEWNGLRSENAAIYDDPFVQWPEYEVVQITDDEEDCSDYAEE